MERQIFPERHDRGRSLRASIFTTSYGRKQAQREALPPSERLSTRQFIDAARGWLERYYQTTVDDGTLSLATYEPRRPDAPEGEHQAFDWDKYAIVTIPEDNTRELIHEIAHVIVGEPHELRHSDYGLESVARPGTLSAENEARASAMELHLLREAGWPGQTVIKDSHLAKFIDDPDWDGVDLDFAGKKDLINILMRLGGY